MPPALLDRIRRRAPQLRIRSNEPRPGDLFDLRIVLGDADTPMRGPLLWYRVEWRIALTLATAFARVAGFAGADEFRLDVLPHGKTSERRAQIRFRFSTRGACRRWLILYGAGGAAVSDDVSTFNLYD